MSYDYQKNPLQKNILARKNPIAYAAITADNTVKTLTLSAACDFVEIKIETAGIRYTLNNVDPSTTVGVPFSPVIDLPLRLFRDEALKIKFTRATATSAVLHVTQFEAG
jgi:hypothetical protein